MGSTTVGYPFPLLGMFHHRGRRSQRNNDGIRSEIHQQWLHRTKNITAADKEGNDRNVAIIVNRMLSTYGYLGPLVSHLSMTWSSHDPNTTTSKG